MGYYAFKNIAGYPVFPDQACDGSLSLVLSSIVITRKISFVSVVSQACPVCLFCLCEGFALVRPVVICQSQKNSQE